MKIRSALILGIVAAVLLAASSAAVTVWYDSQINQLEKAVGQVRIATRNASGLLAMQQDALLHANPRASRQWHAIHAELLQSMHTMAINLGPDNSAMRSVASITSVIEALPKQYDAIFRNAGGDADLERERRETLIDHLTIQTHRISEEAFDLTELLAQQGNASRTKQLQMRAGIVVMFLLYIFSSAFFTLRRILKPLNTLTASALEVQRGNMSVRNAMSRQDEMGLLGRTFDDMTLALQARQQKLVESQRETTSLYKTLNDHSIVSAADRHGNIISVNDAFCRISGYRREELLGQDHRIVKSGLQSDAFWLNFWGVIKSGSAWHGEICNRAQDGSLYWVDSMVMPMRDGTGNIEKYISIGNDITSRKESQAALQISNALLEESQKVAKVGGWELSLETNVLYWTAETYRIHETSPEEFDPTVDAGVGYFLPDSRERIERALKLAIEQGEPYDLELETYTTKGQRIDVRTTCKPWVVDGKVTRLSGIFQDITQRKQYEYALKEARDSAQQAAMSKGQFLANMSHEIRTPMNAVLGLLNLLQSTELTSRQRDYASKTEGAAQSLLGLLNDILDFSEVEAGKMTLEGEPFQIDKLMRNLSVVLSANVGSKDIEVLFDIDPDLPSMVRGDAMRLQQVLINLGGNAVKFTSDGQVVLSLRKMAHTERTVTIEFAVRDTGIGIAPEHQVHIFSGFSQAEGSTTRRFGGSGLGLAIIKRFVELMGGDINITSEQGIGSTFTFTLEMPTLNAALVPQVEIRTELNQSAAQCQRVLVVDDNPIAAELTLRMVRSWGWTAEIAKSGKEAVDLLSAQCNTAIAEFPYPLIYMDWKMPGMDGWEATRQIRELAERSKLPQPTVIMLTAHGRDMLSHRTEAEQERVNGFLVKPATAYMLFDAWMDSRTGSNNIRKLTKGRSSTRHLTGMRILVVEDNLINQQVADELLTSQGAIVSLAANGQLGVEAVAAAAPQFDVVLIDVQMPVLDGYGATRAIREELHLQALPIIAMTANAMDSDREACLAAGMNEHIGKPFDIAKLVSLLIRMTGFLTDVAPSAAQDASALALSPEMPVPEVAGLDIQTALNRMSGMRSLYVRTAKDFVKIMDTAVPELHLCLSAGDKQKALMRLHTLKGNAGTLGATAMAAQAATLEKLCTTSAGMAECEAALVQFEVLVRHTQEKLREAIALFDAEHASNEQAAVEVPFKGVVSDAAREALHHIAALAKSANLEALQVFAQSRALMGEFHSESIDALDEALQNLDLDQASTICDQMLLSLNR